MSRSPSRIEQFFFDPCRADFLSFYRIATAVLGLAVVLMILPAVLDIYGAEGFIQWVVGNELFRIPTLPSLIQISDALSTANVAPDTVVIGAFSVYSACLIAMLVGWHTRIAAGLAWMLHFLILNTSIIFGYGVETFLHIGLFYCMIMPSAECWSLDARAGRTGDKRTSVSARVSQRVIQLHLCIVYLNAGLAKTSGSDWWNGEAIWRSVMQPDFRQFDLSWLAWYPVLTQILSIGVLVVEIGYVFAIWPRRTRVTWLLLTIGLHVGIALFMGLTMFALAMIVLNIAGFGWTPLVRTTHALLDRVKRIAPEIIAVARIPLSMTTSVRSFATRHSALGAVIVALGLSSVNALTARTAVAQPATTLAPQTIPPNALAINDLTMLAARSSVRSWIAEEGKRMALLGNTSAFESIAKASIARRFAGQNVTETTMNALIASVMVQAIKTSNADKAASLQKLQALNDMANALSAQQARLAAASEQLAAKETTCHVPACTAFRSEHSRLLKHDAVIKYGVNLTGAAAAAALKIESAAERAALGADLGVTRTQVDGLRKALGAAVTASGTTAAAIVVAVGAVAAAFTLGAGQATLSMSAAAIVAISGASASAASAGASAGAAAATSAGNAAGNAANSAANAAGNAASTAANAAGNAASSAASTAGKAAESAVKAIASLF